MLSEFAETGNYGLARDIRHVDRRVFPIAPPDAAAISIAGLQKHFGARPVLQGITLDIAPGEFVAVVGRSGCGKSTLLRLLAGLEIPDSAAHGAPPPIVVDGKSTSSLREDARIMFQEARLLPWKRVLDNVAIGQTELDLSMVRAALAQVGLLERANDWPAVLSGGQRQRVALARALLPSPRLLLLDEPLGALDALTRIEMQELIERLWLRRRFTAILVTHDVAEAVYLADRVVIIEDGRIGLEVRVDLPRPRPRTSAEGAALQNKILGQVMAQPAANDDVDQDSLRQTRLPLAMNFAI